MGACSTINIIDVKRMTGLTFLTFTFTLFLLIKNIFPLHYPFFSAMFVSQDFSPFSKKVVMLYFTTTTT